jgi:hypothetical protein
MSLDFPPGFQERVGSFVMIWGKLELSMHMLAWRLLGLSEEEGAIVTKRYDLEDLLTLIKSLADLHVSNTVRPLISKILTEVRSVRGKRNLWTHGGWVVINEDVFVASLRLASDPSKIEMEKVSLRALHSVEQKVRHLIAAADTMSKALAKWRPCIRPQNRYGSTAENSP